MGKMAESGRLGVQKDYLLGLDHLRKMVEGVEIDLDKVKKEFYNVDGTDLAAYQEYLKGLNDQFQYCNDCLEKRGISTEVVDSEMRLVELLNKVQDLDDESLNDSVIGVLTEFWEHIKDTLHRLKAVNLKFQSTVMKRLESTCSSYQNTGETNLDFPAKYSEEVNKYQTEIQNNKEKIDGLVRSFPAGIKQDLFTITNFSQRVLASSDSNAFPILRLVPDISEKLVQMCRLARQWIDKDETYVHDISHQIREQRHNAREKEKELRTQKEKRSKLSKAVIECHHRVKTYKERLGKIGEEIKDLEFQFKSLGDSKKFKQEEVKQKEGMVGFLDISISQTKKNYSLQLKKSRIVRQLKELEEFLKQIERDIKSMEREVEMKQREKSVVVEKVEENNNSYHELKADLDDFTENVDKVQQQMTEMGVQLQQLEIIQTFKTSPEKVDNFYDKPVTAVKLAPSLKEKIQRRRKLLENAGKKDGGTPASEEDRSEPGGFFLTE